jgi:hypothetical protein
MCHNLSVYNDIDFELIARRMIEDKVKSGVLSDRGNYQRTAGFTNINLKVEEKREVAMPQVVRGTTADDVKLMIKVTRLLREACELSGREVPFSSDPERTSDFALSLCTQFGLPSTTSDGIPNNLFEALTIVVSVCEHSSHKGASLFGKPVPDPTLLVHHFDKGNLPFSWLFRCFCSIQTHLSQGHGCDGSRWFSRLLQEVCV